MMYWYFLDEKIGAASVILEALGNCGTGLNKNASRHTQHVTVDFDSHGLVASVMFQVYMFFIGHQFEPEIKNVTTANRGILLSTHGSFSAPTPPGLHDVAFHY